MGNRFSALPIAQYCGLGPKLSAKGGAGRAAAMGSAFHARCADPAGEEAKERWARLSFEERNEVSRWIRPTSLILENGFELSYETARKEVPLGLTERGAYAPKGTPGNITDGTCDLYWIVEIDGLRVAYVPDIKRSTYTVADGPDSLQILGYAIAVMQLEQCDGYCAGIWAAEEGSWWWGPLFIEGRDDEAMADNWLRVKAAARNTSEEPNFGVHCQGCYGRSLCPAWIMPPEVAGTTLSPFAAGGEAITADKATELLLAIKRVEDMSTAVKTRLRIWQGEGNRVLDPVSMKEWKPIKVSGRVTLDKDAFEKEQPELFKVYSKQGAPSEQYRWVNSAELNDSKKKGRGK